MLGRHHKQQTKTEWETVDVKCEETLKKYVAWHMARA